LLQDGLCAAAATEGAILAVEAIIGISLGGVVVAIIIGIVIYQIYKFAKKRSPQFKCTKCGGFHSGTFGNLCQLCHFKENGNYDPASNFQIQVENIP